MPVISLMQDGYGCESLRFLRRALDCGTPNGSGAQTWSGNPFRTALFLVEFCGVQIDRKLIPELPDLEGRAPLECVSDLRIIPLLSIG